MKVDIQYFSDTFIFPPSEKPVWADSIPRWHQMDAACFGLVEAYHTWKKEYPTAFLKKPSLIILASPLASNQADFDFVKSEAKSPSKMIHTLPSTRAAPLCQAMDWSGPLLCLQNDPSTQVTGLMEGYEFVGEDCPFVWVMGVVKTAPVQVNLFQLRLSEGEIG